MTCTDHPATSKGTSPSTRTAKYSTTWTTIILRLILQQRKVSTWARRANLRAIRTSSMCSAIPSLACASVKNFTPFVLGLAKDVPNRKELENSVSTVRLALLPINTRLAHRCNTMRCATVKKAITGSPCPDQQRRSSAPKISC